MRDPLVSKRLDFWCQICKNILVIAQKNQIAKIMHTKCNLFPNIVFFCDIQLAMTTQRAQQAKVKQAQRAQRPPSRRRVILHTVCNFTHNV